MKKWFAIVLVLALLTGCSAPVAGTEPSVTTLPRVAQQGEALRVGICMPTGQEDHWQESARLLQSRLTELGYEVQVYFAENEAQEQARQLGKLLEKGVDCLVIGAVDSLELLDGLEQARKSGIPVVAYDRLLMDTQAVSSYVTFDYEAIGAAMGQQLVELHRLETAKEEKRSYAVEFLMGSPDDNNAVLLHKGLLAVLQPWLDSGVLHCPSGRVSFADTYTLRWDPDTASTQLERLISLHYEKGCYPDICVAASDALAQGCREALIRAGCKENKLPTITGQGGSEDALKRIGSGQQAFSVFTDLRMLTENCVMMVRSHLKGEMPQTGSTADNHAMAVPTVLCAGTLIHQENYRQVMVDSGLYTEDTLP